MATKKNSNPDYVDFGDVARKQIGQQCQYARHYLKNPEINEGIRWEGKFEDYHSLTIHKDDVEKFVTRSLTWLRAQGIIK